MRREIDSAEKVIGWLASPQPSIFQGQDLRQFDAAISQSISQDCIFLGCEIGPLLGKAILDYGCTIIGKPNLVFQPFKPSLYTAEELYDFYDISAPHSYFECLDRKIYCTYIDCTITGIPEGKRPQLDVDLNEALMRRVHDWSISDALHELVPDEKKPVTVAIMGGHNISRRDDKYKETVLLALALAEAGFFIVTGGGPGLMEAANLGAYLAGFNKRSMVLEEILTVLKDAPLYSDANWLQRGFEVKKMLGEPDDRLASQNLGIPTWFYGHEPPNVFATDIAKYFENSVREEGLLAIAWGGIIFAPGNGGTVQEIFQDANQNYYRLFGERKSPMVLYDVDFWNPRPSMPVDKKQKPLYPLLLALSKERDFEDMVMLTDSREQILDFIIKTRGEKNEGGF